MINSMTGFASRSQDYDYGQLNLELRSVNHRYLEVQMRIPDELRSLEAGLREAIGVKIVTDVDKSGFVKIAAPLQDKLAKDLGPHAVKIKDLIAATK